MSWHARAFIDVRYLVLSFPRDANPCLTIYYVFLRAELLIVVQSVDWPDDP